MALRLKTIRHGMALVTTSLTSGVEQAMTSTTIYSPETTSRTFRSVVAVFAVGDEASSATSTTDVSMSLTLGAAAKDTTTVSDTITNSGESCGFVFTRDCTAYFAANFGSGSSQTCQMFLTITGAANYENLSCYLLITYEYDDGAATQIKTVGIPMDGANTALTSTYANMGGVANQIPNLSTFLPEASVTIRNAFLETWGGEGRTASTNSTSLFLRVDGATDLQDNQHVSNLNSSRFFLRVDNVTGGFTTNATHNLEVKRENTSASFDCISSTLWVTYEYNEASTTTVLNSLVVPLGQVKHNLRGATGDKDRLTADVWIEEPGSIAMVQSAVHVMLAIDAACTVDARAGGQASRTYAFAAAAVNCGGVSFQRRIDSGESGGVAAATLARGKNTITVDLFQTTSVNANAVAAYLILNYTSGKASAGTSAHNHTVAYLNGAYAADAVQRTVSAAAGVTPNVPESSYWLQATGLEVLHMTQSTARLETWNQVVAECQSGEGAGAGWVDACNYQVLTADDEIGLWRLWSATPGMWKRWPSDTDASRLDLETQRDWSYHSAPTAYMQALLWFTYHSVTVTKSGTVRGYTGDGSGIAVKVYDDTDGALVASATTAAGGTWSATWYDDTRSYHARAEQDANRVGSSRSLSTNTLDVDLGRRGPVVGPGGIVRVP